MDYSVFGYAKPIENADGSLIVIAVIINSNNKAVNRLMKLDVYGNLIWQKDYYTRPDKNQYIGDIKSTADGGYIICGQAFPVGSNTQQAWLIKTNCNGEEGVQHPITATPCDQYDCTLYPVDASFTPSATYVDLGIESGLVTFENNSANTTSRVWNFGDGVTDYTDSIISHTYTQPGVYEVELIVFHGMCSDTVTQIIEVVNTAGVASQHVDFGLNVYPNPNNGNVNVTFELASQSTLVLYDAVGREVYKNKLTENETKIQFDNLSNGVYTLNVTYQGGKIETKRIIVR